MTRRAIASLYLGLVVMLGVAAVSFALAPNRDGPEPCADPETGVAIASEYAFRAEIWAMRPALGCVDDGDEFTCAVHETMRAKTTTDLGVRAAPRPLPSASGG